MLFTLQFHINNPERISEDERQSLVADLRTVEAVRGVVITRVNPEIMHVGCRITAPTPDDALDWTRDLIKVASRYSVSNVLLRTPGSSLNLFPRRLGAQVLAEVS